MKNTDFIFNGTKSIDMGLYIVSIEGGLHSDKIYGGQSIIEERVGKRPNPYFNRTEKQPIEFEVTFSLLEGKWTPEKRFEIAKWLIHEDYKPFQTVDDLGKYYYAMVINPWDLEYNGEDKGYVRVTFRTDAFHAWSPVYYQEFDLRNNTDTTNIILENKSNVYKYYHPKIEFKLYDNSTGILIKNLSDGGREFKFEDLFEGETVSVDNEGRFIKSDLADVYRLSNFNRKWLRLVYGQNNIEVIGKCILKIKSQFPIVR